MFAQSCVTSSQLSNPRSHSFISGKYNAAVSGLFADVFRNFVLRSSKLISGYYVIDQNLD